MLKKIKMSELKVLEDSYIRNPESGIRIPESGTWNP